MIVAVNFSQILGMDWIICIFQTIFSTVYLRCTRVFI